MQPWFLLTLVLAGLVLILYWSQRRQRARLLATVRPVTLGAVPSGYLANQRDITVYLPPAYDDRPGERYPVLYLNDGQDRGQLKLHETLARLQAAGHIRPLLVVAIPTNDQRLQEYGTAVAANAKGYGDRAAAYSRFITEELLPLIDGQFRTRTEPAGRAILGASLGGLSAFDLAWNHPDLFGTAGVFSGSFWWRAAEDETAIAPGRRIMHQQVRDAAADVDGPKLRLWFEAATRDEQDDRDNNGVIDAIQDTLELMDELVAQGYRPGRDMVYVEVEGGRHDYDTWSKWLPDFLCWAFPAKI
jgi:iron(III)-enterobactin esterase